MNSDDVNDRKQKLNDIIKKITESQLLKIREADTNSCNRQECKFSIDQEKKIEKAMTIKQLSRFSAPVGSFKPTVAGSSSEIPAPLPKPVGPGVTL